jgi:hypothetical protein
MGDHRLLGYQKEVMQKMQQLETEVELYLRRRVEQAGGRCVKFHPDHQRGWPDRLVLLPRGLLLWVELKRPQGGRVSGAQRVAHEDLRRLGQRVELVRSKEEVDALMEELLFQ